LLETQLKPKIVKPEASKAYFS